MTKPLATALALLAPALALAPLSMAAVAWAGPVVCTTSLEAPLAASDAPASAPVEVTRCTAVQTTPELVRQRFYTYTASFARGVSVTNQITDLFGIARGGEDGRRLMGFGFPDQTIVWDGTALENTYRALLELQSEPMPWRTADLPNGFSGSLGGGGASPGGLAIW